ncbi:MAG TPA: N-acetyl-alpha-D-glucosaminyl L-malate synthase BshA [Polyangia bacterium]|jgi:N-acetyl-alpha-D-glucosaminyl L-malate synthase BshA|nr:N-acetyl-alpha-D-glucosaminyl L-malate synthase BshA [Polyangia bacterium]
MTPSPPFGSRGPQRPPAGEPLPAPARERGPGENLHIGITCYPTFGGSGIIATEIGLGLAERGHRVHFIAYDVPSRLDRFVENVFFHEVEVRDYPLFDHSPYPLALASKMVEVSTYATLDLLHVHYAIPHATSAYLARQILGSRSPRIITTLHGTDITLVGSDPSFLPITRFSIEQSDGLTVPSHYLRRATYENLGVSPDVPIEVIPNFVDTDKYRPLVPRRKGELRHLFDRVAADWDDPAAAPPILIHNSNFRPLKRVDDVVRILAEVRRAVPALLILVGDGPERSRVESLARELGLTSAVCFLGKQLNFVEVLQCSDVFLLPSETESFGLAALEALACGVPVVASRVGGVPEVVSEGETGFLCDVGDVRAMAAAVLRLVQEPAVHARMAETARVRVEAEWRREPMVTRYEEYYRKILGR